MLEKLKNIMMDVIHLEDTTDIRGTIDTIRGSIKIKGYNIWILACGALLASIGLDQNSPAIIIGAMLISPLMSPILGIGLAVGINDRETLIDGLINFGVAVAASLLMSVIYFLLTPLGNTTPEIIARTSPNLLDAFVAIFGGIAGIVAGSRKDKTNAIPGVAIATALMPPVCVAGYGLAKWNMPIFFGSFYLFFLNAFFIALSTYVIVRFLRFPYLDYIDSKTRARVKRYITFFVIIMILPSTWILYNTVQKTRLKNNVNFFVDTYIRHDKYSVINSEYVPTDSINYLYLSMPGHYLSEDSLAALEGYLPDCGLKDTRLVVVDDNVTQADLEKIKIEVQSNQQEAQKSKQELDAKTQRINMLQAKLDSIQADTVRFAELKGEVRKLIYPDADKLLSISYTTEAISVDKEDNQNRMPLLILDWNDRLITRRNRRQHEERVRLILPEYLGIDTVSIISR